MGMTVCPMCRSPLNATGVKCEACNSLIPDRVSVLQDLSNNVTAKELQDCLATIKRNLDELQYIPRPTIKEAILTVLWWYGVILTIGVLAIFVKPPKTFKKSSLEKVLIVLRRNISIAKIHSSELPELRSMIEVLEKDMLGIENEFKQKLKARLITFLVVIAIVLGFSIYAIATKDQRADLSVDTTNQTIEVTE